MVYRIRTIAVSDSLNIFTVSNNSNSSYHHVGFSTTQNHVLWQSGGWGYRNVSWAHTIKVISTDSNNEESREVWEAGNSSRLQFYPRGMTSPSIRRIVQIECGFFFYLFIGRVSCGSCPAAKANKYISGVELHSGRNCLAVSLGLLGHQEASLIYPGEVGLDWTLLAIEIELWRWPCPHIWWPSIASIHIHPLVTILHVGEKE